MAIHLSRDLFMKHDYSFKRLIIPGLILTTASASVLGTLGCVGPFSTRVQKTVVVGDADNYSTLQAEADAKAKAEATNRMKANAALQMMGVMQEVKKATRKPDQTVTQPAATEAAAQAASKAAVDDAVQQSISTQIPSGQMGGGDF